MATERVCIYLAPFLCLLVLGKIQPSWPQAPKYPIGASRFSLLPQTAHLWLRLTLPVARHWSDWVELLAAQWQWCSLRVPQRWHQFSPWGSFIMLAGIYPRGCSNSGRGSSNTHGAATWGSSIPPLLSGMTLVWHPGIRDDMSPGFTLKS